jgi:hypothetical protein
MAATLTQYNPHHICPLCNKIMREPVAASDGHVYEYMEAKKLIESKTASPISKQQLLKSLYPLLFLKDDIAKFIRTNPDAQKDQYKPFYKDNVESVKLAVKNQNYEVLKTYLEYDVSCMQKNNLLIPILQQCPNDVLTHVFDNIVGIEDKLKDGLKLIHLICEHCNESAIKYALNSQFMDCESATKDGLRPIHLLVQHSSATELLRYAIQTFKINLEAETKTGYRPIHYACYKGDSKVIQMLVDSGVSLDTSARKI